MYSYSVADSDSLIEEATSTKNPSSMVDNIDVDSRFGRVTGGVETYLVSITPFSVHIIVNVTSPSTVWCKAIEQEERLKEVKVMAEKGQFVKGRKLLIPISLLLVDEYSYSISHLKPNTNYNIMCFGLQATDDSRVLHYSKPINTITSDGMLFTLFFFSFPSLLI